MQPLCFQYCHKYDSMTSVIQVMSKDKQGAKNKSCKTVLISKTMSFLVKKVVSLKDLQEMSL